MYDCQRIGIHPEISIQTHFNPIAKSRESRYYNLATIHCYFLIWLAVNKKVI